MFPIAFYGSTMENKSQVLQDLKTTLEELGVQTTEVKQTKRKKRGIINTKANCFHIMIRKPDQKLRFIRQIGSSNPHKYDNLVALSEMIVSPG
jgi:hypothetical protein